MDSSKLTKEQKNAINPLSPDTEKYAKTPVDEIAKDQITPNCNKDEWIENMLSGNDNPRTPEDEKYLKSLDEKWIAEQKKKLNEKK